jgi:hypothetical protein
MIVSSPKTETNMICFLWSFYFNYLGSIITNDARCTREIKSRIAMAKAALNKKTLFISKLNLNLR